MNSQNRAKFRDPPVVSEFNMVVRTELAFSLVTEDLRLRREFRVVGRNHAAFSGGHDLGGVERGCSRKTEGSRKLAFQRTALSMRRILHKRDLILIANLTQVDDIRVDVAADMDDKDGTYVLV